MEIYLHIYPMSVMISPASVDQRGAYVPATPTGGDSCRPPEVRYVATVCGGRSQVRCSDLLLPARQVRVAPGYQSLHIREARRR